MEKHMGVYVIEMVSKGKKVCVGYSSENAVAQKFTLWLPPRSH